MWNNVTCLCSLPKDNPFFALWDNRECMAYYDEDEQCFYVVDVVKVDKASESRLTHWQEIPPLDEMPESERESIENLYKEIKE